MAACELLAGCVFFHDNMVNMLARAELMKQGLCLVNNRACARYRVYQALGRSKVPTDLFPNHTEQANMLISPHSDLKYDRSPLKGGDAYG